MGIKTKYDVLSNEDKKNLKKEYFDTPRGKVVKKSLFLSRMCSILCIIWGFIILIWNLNQEHSTVTYIYSAVVAITGIIMLFMGKSVIKKRLNLYIVKNKS